MLEKYKSFLGDIYEFYKTTGKREIQYKFENPEDKNHFYECFNYLYKCGYLDKVAPAAGFFVFKLTPYGIDFIENDYQDPITTPIIQGNNSIYIKGSSNTVTDNYNTISIDIANSDLPEEYKELMESFLYEIKNPKLTPEKKTDKIKLFLSDLTSGTLSGAAASGLTVLFSSLLKQIPF